MNKEELRKFYLEKRKSFSSHLLEEKSNQIINNFLGHFNITGLVHVFLPIKKFNEINTWPLVEKLYVLNISVATSVLDFESNDLLHYRLSNESKFKINDWGVPEPVDGIEVNPMEIQHVIIPLIICDEIGHRIGYGKGFYDKFLSKCSPEINKIGFSIFEPIEKFEEIEPHDIALDYCVSPSKVYNFKRE